MYNPVEKSLAAIRPRSTHSAKIPSLLAKGYLEQMRDGANFPEISFTGFNDGNGNKVSDPKLSPSDNSEGFKNQGIHRHRWTELLSKYEARTLFIKFGLPALVWVRIAAFLPPEDNIKLSLVTVSDYENLRSHEGEFFSSRIGAGFAPIPEWYDPDNFVLNYIPWSRCPPTVRRGYFELITGIRVFRCDARCAILPPDDLMILFRQSANTLELFELFEPSEDIIEQWSKPLPISSKMKRLLIPQDMDSGILVDRKLLPLTMLKSLILNGPYTLYWIRFLRNCRFDNLETVCVCIPTVIDTMSKIGEHSLSLNPSIRKIQAVITRFFSNFPKGRRFQLNASVHDEIGRLIISSFLHWIGSACASSKSFESIELISKDLKPLLSCFYQHLIDGIYKEGGAPELIEDSSGWLTTLPFFTFNGDSGLPSFPPTLTESFSSTRSGILCDGIDDTELKTILDERVAVARSIVESGVRGRGTKKYSKGFPKLTRHALLATLVTKEKLRRATKKAIKTLRSRTAKLSSIKLNGVIGAWAEIVGLRVILGSDIGFSAYEFSDCIGHPSTSAVLTIVAESLQRLRFTVTPFPLSHSSSESMIHQQHPTKKPVTDLRKKHPFGSTDARFSLGDGINHSHSIVGLRRLETSEMTLEFQENIRRLPILKLNRLELLALNNLDPEQFSLIEEGLAKIHLNSICHSQLSNGSQSLHTTRQTHKSDDKESKEKRPERKGILRKERTSQEIIGASSRPGNTKPCVPPLEIRKKSKNNKSALFIPLKLEILFTEPSSHYAETLKNENSFYVLKRLIDLYNPAEVTICPCPHMNILHEYRKIINGSHYYLVPYTSTRLNTCWSAMTATNLQPITSKKPSPPSIMTHVTLSCLDDVHWLLQCGYYEQSQNLNEPYVAPVEIIIQKSVESLVGLAFAWDNFSLIQSIGNQSLERLFQSSIYHLTYCDVIQMFSDSLNSLTIYYTIAIDMLFDDPNKICDFFVAIIRQFHEGLLNRDCDYFTITADVQFEHFVKPLPKELQYVFPPKVQVPPLPVDTVDEKMTDSKENVETETIHKCTTDIHISKDIEEEEKVFKEVAEFKEDHEKLANEKFFKALQAIGVEREDPSSFSSSSFSMGNESRSESIDLRQMSIDKMDSITRKRSNDAIETISEEKSIPPLIEPDPQSWLQSPTLLEAEVQPDSFDESSSRRLRLSIANSNEEDKFVHRLKKQLHAMSKILQKSKKQKTSENKLCNFIPPTESLSRQRYTLDSVDLLQSSFEVLPNYDNDESLYSGKFQHLAPLILDSTGAYLENGIVSPPYPEAGVFMIKIEKDPDLILSNNLMSAKRGVLVASRFYDNQENNESGGTPLNKLESMVLSPRHLIRRHCVP